MKQDELLNRRKRLIMRAEHRGIKEMDIIMGGYVRAHVDQWSAEVLDEMEALMCIDDQTLYAMIAGHMELDPDFRARLEKIREFIQKNT